MKKLLIASVIAGAAIAGLLFYLRDQLGKKKRLTMLRMPPAMLTAP